MRPLFVCLEGYKRKTSRSGKFFSGETQFFAALRFSDMADSGAPMRFALKRL